MKFSHAIVCTPCKNMIHGISTSNSIIPNYLNAMDQHQQYVKILKELGVDVTELPPNDSYPDSTFIEDTAILTSSFAIISNPGDDSRKGEINAIENYLKSSFSDVENINYPGTLDGGDVLEIENQFYVGISNRTNQAGAEQFVEFVGKYGMTCTTIPVNKGLHLKSSVSYLGHHCLLIDSDSLSKEYFSSFDLICTEEREAYSANAISVNGTVIMPSGFPKTRKKVECAGFSVRTLNMSEFRKLDGGLSCLSLRY